jgi:hypothetical protein
MKYDFSYPPVYPEQRAASEENRRYARDIFERCVNHLLKQGRRSMALNAESLDQNMQCVYRGEDGLMCGVGCLIDDVYYSEELEGECSSETRVLWALRNSGVDATTTWYDGAGRYSVYGLLSAVQELHDKMEPEDWRAEAATIAAAYCLYPKEQA